jgi:hypothetical protein
MEEIALGLLKSSPALGLALLISYFYKQNGDKFFALFNEQVSARLTSQEKELSYLRTKSDICEKDRQHLSQEIIKMKAAAGMKFSLVNKEREDEENEQQ